MWDISVSFLTYESLTFGAGPQQGLSANGRSLKPQEATAVTVSSHLYWTHLRPLILAMKRQTSILSSNKSNNFHSPWGYVVFVAQQSQALYFITTNAWEYKSLLICNFTLTSWTGEDDFDHLILRLRSLNLPLSNLVHSYWNADGWTINYRDWKKEKSRTIL